MNQEAFENWSHKHFVPEVWAFLKERALPQKVVLLLDNAPCHTRDSTLTSEYCLIIVQFLPSEVTAIIQPMDQAMIVSMKQCYRTGLLRNLADKDDTITGLWKKNECWMIYMVYLGHGLP
jgi:hypothetical protein